MGQEWGTGRWIKPQVWEVLLSRKGRPRANPEELQCFKDCKTDLEEVT